MRALATCAALVLAAAACFSDDAPTSQVGGTQFNIRLNVPSPVRLPSGSVAIFQRTVSGNRLIDSVTVSSLALLEPLRGPARYQFWVVNGLDESSRPVQVSVARTRTDTSFNATGAVTTTTVTTNEGRRTFFDGAPFNTVTTVKIGPTQSADSVSQTGAWLVLTIQADTASPSFADAPKPLWFRLRNQQNTPVLTDDVISANGSLTFGTFVSSTSQRPFSAQGFGRGAFWDEFNDGALHLSALAFGLTQPPLGYYYVPVSRNTTVGRVMLLGELVDATTGEPQRDADLRPVPGTVAQMPNVRFMARDDTLSCPGGIDCGFLGFAEEDVVQLLLEPKLGIDSIFGISSVLQGANNLQLTDTRRAAAGTVIGSAQRAGQPVAGAVIALYGAGGTTVFATGVTAANGEISFSGVPAGRIDARISPPSGTSIADPYQRNLEVPAGDTLRVVFQLQ